MCSGSSPTSEPVSVRMWIWTCADYQSDDTGNVITSLTFTPENGKFVEIKDYLGNLQIGVEDYTNADLGLNSTSTLKDSINAISTKLASNLSAAENYVNNKIDTLKVED